MIKISTILRFNCGFKLNTNNDSEKLDYLKEEKESLEYDLDSIGPAIKAASKISNEEKPTEEENECLSELKDNYPTFFDSEGEEEGSSSLLNKIMGVKRYLSKEINANIKSINSLKGKHKESSSQSKESVIEEDSSKKSVIEEDSSEESVIEKDSSKEFIIEKGESSKRKADEISEGSESSSSKKIKSSSEIIDDISYNPFDDIGTD